VQCVDIEEIFNVNITYLQKIEYKLSKIVDFIINITRNNKSLGIYVPSRIINILSQVSRDFNLNNIEFFDDNPNIIGTYFPGFTNKIKSRSELINNPPDYVLIMSHTFGDSIKENIIKLLDDKSIVIKYSELL